ncbi:MAG TPA: hypothetical protein PK268_03675 [Enterococcus sp.]|nr:GNAT family N-acetyltransferase [Enterococcus sp.]HPR80987.1 hypothetical protein [Enterococcus sp.]
MHIRPIQEKDNAAIANIIRENLEYYHLDVPGTAYFDSELDQLSHFYSLPNAAYWVLVENEQVLGGVGVAPFKEHVAALSQSYSQRQRLRTTVDDSST